MQAGKSDRQPVHLVDSGDLGRWNRPILRDSELVPEADFLLGCPQRPSEEKPDG